MGSPHLELPRALPWKNSCLRPCVRVGREMLIANEVKRKAVQVRFELHLVIVRKPVFAPLLFKCEMVSKMSNYMYEALYTNDLDD